MWQWRVWRVFLTVWNSTEMSVLLSTRLLLIWLCAYTKRKLLTTAFWNIRTATNSVSYYSKYFCRVETWKMAVTCTFPDSGPEKLWAANTCCFLAQRLRSNSWRGNIAQLGDCAHYNLLHISSKLQERLDIKIWDNFPCLVTNALQILSRPSVHTNNGINFGKAVR
jgi:hypothetical protein